MTALLRSFTDSTQATPAHRLLIVAALLVGLLLVAMVPDA